MALRLPTGPAKGLEEIALKDLIPPVVGGRHRPLWQRLLPHSVTRQGVVLEHHVREGRFQRSLALIAGLSSLPSGFEVAYEHYRGSYSQLIMYSPVVLSPLLFLAGVAGAFSRRAARTVRATKCRQPRQTPACHDANQYLRLDHIQSPTHAERPPPRRR